MRRFVQGVSPCYRSTDTESLLNTNTCSNVDHHENCMIDEFFGLGVKALQMFHHQIFTNKNNQPISFVRIDFNMHRQNAWKEGGHYW